MRQSSFRDDRDARRARTRTTPNAAKRGPETNPTPVRPAADLVGIPLRATRRSDSAAIQRNPTPESRSIVRMLAASTEDGALFSNPEDIRAIHAIQDVMPMMPAATAAKALSAAPVATEAWSNLFMSPGLHIAGLPENDAPSPFRNAIVPGQERRWQMREPVARGSEATVFRGREQWNAQDPDVAIKVFRRPLAAPGGPDPVRSMDDAFENEVNAHREIAQHDIPNVVRMRDHNRLLRAVVMDFVPGTDLHTLAQQGPLGDKVTSAVEAARLQTEEALAKHGRRLADLQPRNIMYDESTGKVTFVDVSLEDSPR